MQCEWRDPHTHEVCGRDAKYRVDYTGRTHPAVPDAHASSALCATHVKNAWAFGQSLMPERYRLRLARLDEIRAAAEAAEAGGSEGD